MSGDRLRLAVGCVAMAASAAIAGGVWGSGAMRGAVALGVVAVLIQMLAPRLARQAGTAATVDKLGGYLIGTVLRFAAVALIALVAVVTRDRATGLGAAVGYLGTILPLLYVETRTER
ncbi:MAG TPA: hypothetical protein VFN90_11465 [Gemmatimonadales bacterium]|nr:hypothetical protein [Gemmatimonadales bacterium]